LCSTPSYGAPKAISRDGVNDVRRSSRPLSCRGRACRDEVDRFCSHSLASPRPGRSASPVTRRKMQALIAWMLNSLECLLCKRPIAQQGETMTYRYRALKLCAAALVSLVAGTQGHAAGSDADACRSLAPPRCSCGDLNLPRERVPDCDQPVTPLPERDIISVLPVRGTFQASDQASQAALSSARASA
jgi:hypothetical protein